MKQKEVQELAESVGALVEKILKLALRDKKDEDDDKKGSPEKGSHYLRKDSFYLIKTNVVRIFYKVHLEY